ncbi:Ninein-like protein [Oryzias melastigma]|uniref:Ninein-like protein n=1 Tax=Oryzias melastigma TaxID=30732 RepID=A0A834CMP5_ORYME|nr:Ninein-like protein [Oryzias melastigma]
MEEAGHSHYVAQLKAEFDGCDTTATGFLDRDELTELCRRLQLDAQLPLLLHTLLGERTHGRVNFEEFKEAFVEVLSRSLDLNTSEDDSSYLDSAVFEEMKPKFVKGAKRYGRRSRPDSEALTCDSEDSPPSKNEATDLSASGVRRAKQRRSTSLESVESLKSDEDTGSQRSIQPPFQSKGEEEQLEAGGGEGLLTDHLSLQHLHSEDMNGRFCRTEAQLDGGVSITEFRRFLSSSSPASRSTPKRGADLQRAPHWSQAPLEERPARSAAPSLLTATVGQRVLSRLDDGSGCTSPERVAALWTEEGIQNSRDILQTLDFSLEERLSLADLTLALDNELLVSGNGIHQAALISYKNEIQLLQEAADQACRERDKLRADLEEADHRNLQLVREVDDRHASMETLNQSKIRDLEQDFRDRLTTLRCEAELESEAQLQLGEEERRALQEELQLLRAQEAELQEELRHAAQENRRLEEELRTLKEKLTEAETSTNRLQADLSQLLLHKFGGLDPARSALRHEERVSELIKEYELQCRVLQDKNDELSLELEILKNRRRRREAGDASAPSWKQQHEESDDLDMNRSSSPPVTQPDQKPAPDGAAGPTVSIQTELAVEQLQQKHRQELQQLSIQLETQMNFYERSLEKMRESMEVERKDISQAFKLEISELEEQKTQLEQEVKQLKAALDRLQKQTLHGGGGGWSSEQERRMQRERAELEQNFAREIGNLVQRLSSEKEQLEAELKLKMDQEVMAVKEELESCKASWEEQRKMEVQHKEEIRRLEEEVKEFHQSKRSLELDSCSVTGRSSEEELPVHLCSSLLQERHGALQLQASEQTVASLRSELRSQQEALRSKARSICSLAAELDLLKTDRRRLIQDLKDQAMAVDHLQLELDGASEELNQRRSNEASLQEALKREQSRTSQLQSGLQEQQEELCRLAQEKSRSVRLADQLSAQILEMEEEISSLREHLRGLSARLNDTADLVLELRRQLNSRTSEEAARGAQNNELERVREQVLLLQRALQNSQNQLGSAQENFDRERGRMVQQLMGMERLVLELEKEMDPAGSDRTQLEEVRSDNQALQERLSVLQHQVQNLEEEVSKKRRRLEELEQEHQRSREEEERLHKENSRCREEVLDLSSRNLKLSSDNGELSARLRQEQESLQKLQEAMTRTSKQEEEEVRRLQEEVKRKEQEELHQQEAWREERRRLEEQLSSSREKLKLHQHLEAELSSLTMKVQLLQEDKEQLQKAADGRQEQLLAVKQEAELLRSQLHTVTQEKIGHAQEVVELRRKLLEVQSQVEEQHGQTRRLQEQEEELHRLMVQNQQLQQQVSELQVQELQVHKLSQDQQNLRTRLSQAEAARTQALDQAAQADAALALLQAQLQRQKHQEGGGLRERAELLQVQLDAEEKRSRQLEENLKLQVQQSRSQFSMKQEQYEKAMSALQQRVDDLEVKLKGVRLVLQEKVQELREQLVKSSKASALLKDAHAENAQLMTALQVTEHRQKLAERRSVLLEEKVGALHQLLRDIVPTALAT